MATWLLTKFCSVCSVHFKVPYKLLSVVVFISSSGVLILAASVNPRSFTLLWRLSAQAAGPAASAPPVQTPALEAAWPRCLLATWLKPTSWIYEGSKLISLSTFAHREEEKSNNGHKSTFWQLLTWAQVNAWEQLEQKRRLWISLPLIRSRTGSLLETKNSPLDLEGLAVKERTGPNKNCSWFNAAGYSFLKGSPPSGHFFTAPRANLLSVKWLCVSAEGKGQRGSPGTPDTSTEASNSKADWDWTSCSLDCLILQEKGKGEFIFASYYFPTTEEHDLHTFQNAVFTVNQNGNMIQTGFFFSFWST